ncbi:MAG: SGNH/GDSL hydrolase family protein [Hyphomicrobiaceae bacterium]
MSPKAHHSRPAGAAWAVSPLPISLAAARLRHQLIAFATAALALLGSQIPAALARAPCSAPAELSQSGEPLYVLRTAVDAGTGIRIVALGSSSTRGAGASKPEFTYPSQLAKALRRVPGRYTPVRVFNRGIGGELATDMLARLQRDVLALRPHLVVWQTGVNDAIRGVAPAEFRSSLSRGIEMIRAAGIDVILLDMQYYPGSGEVPGYQGYANAMRSVARQHHVSMLSRYAFMRYQIEQAHFAPEQLLAPDLFHLNDLSYRCLGNLVADSIVSGLQRATERTLIAEIAGGDFETVRKEMAAQHGSRRRPPEGIAP